MRNYVPLPTILVIGVIGKIVLVQTPKRNHYRLLAELLVIGTYLFIYPLVLFFVSIKISAPYCSVFIDRFAFLFLESRFIHLLGRIWPGRSHSSLHPVNDGSAALRRRSPFLQTNRNNQIFLRNPRSIGIRGPTMNRIVC